MNIKVRTARPDEYAEVGELVARAYIDGGLLDLGEDDPYLERLRDAADRAEHAELLVAEGAGGTLLGSVTFVGDGGPYAERAEEGEAEFRMLGVRAGARGMGVGEALVAACLERARDKGFAGLVLSTQQRMHAARRLYERIGFQRAPERDWMPVPDLDLTLWAYTLRL
ncbi:GNAT family N-acetyltransferase [Streptomyces iconiensis]|uniref:GNAT family N-acetyltransferase n=1 Tax=Streptomyces iconiensis TaxID=1384038 RepID=A0ABT7A2L5_9ACTN|nr:GNAT family N-acetyltransferase [Streptomyces iconiensis]MDJ1135562.1 GNAT family N-acetyltransferase [Streptomyces iconiensis]